jgi:iron complex outermembrane recepter protein
MLSSTEFCVYKTRASYALAFMAAMLMAFTVGQARMQAQAHGQTTNSAAKATGKLSGAVLDPHQARVVGAMLQLRNISTGEVFTASSSTDGSYKFTEIPSGFYELEVAAKGFRTSLVSGIQIQETRHVSQNVVLDIGPATQKVFVYAEQGFDTVPLKAPTTTDVLGKSTNDALLNEAQTGSYLAMDMLPSVNDQFGDAYGLALGKTLRLRGAFSTDEFLRNVEGSPVNDHGGGGDFIDFENVRHVTAYRGAIPTASGFGIRNMTGAEDLSVLWPREKFAAYAKQSAGEDGFLRTFARLDTGRLSTGTAAFFSYSYTEANKWRGAGGQPSGRHNGEISISQNFGNRATFQIVGIHHELKQDDFRSLTYAQATNLGLDTNYYYDYNKTLTGTSSTDINYYGYTRQTYLDTMLLADFELKLPHDSKLTVKPYYWKDSGYRWIGGSVALNGVTYYGYKWMETRPQDYGFTAQYDFSLKKVNFSAGYWLQSEPDSLPPPLAQKFFAFNTGTTAKASFLEWTSLEKVSNRNYDAPYINANTTIGKTSLAGSLKFLHQTDPSAAYYSTTGLGNISYNAALATNPAYLYGVNRHVWRAWEPSFSITQAFTPRLNAYFAYGQGYEATSFASVAGVYHNNQAQFQKYGYTLATLWSGLKPEHYENFDFGARYKGNFITVAPNFYILLDHHKAVTVYDPVVQLAYTRSNVDASGYGFEAEFTAHAPNLKRGALQFYFAPSYNNLEYDNNTQYASPSSSSVPSGVVASKGKQMVDTPQWMVKLAAMYSYNGFSVTPLVRFIGVRYGDITNKQRVSSYPLLNLSSRYTPTRGAFQNVTLSLNAVNLLNKRYIGVINTSDFNVLNNYSTPALSTAASYYPGAPRTIMGGVAFQLDGIAKSFSK